MATTDPAAPGARILLVEDDPEAASFIVKVLERRGFDVVHTADPAAALVLVGAESWDLVLTDVLMPGMTGIELLELLREADPGLPVAVITAYATVDTAIGALRNHADDFQEKPLRPAQLVAMVSGLVIKGRAARLARREVVLAIGAHPDDVEIGAAGTLIAHRKMGHDVAILTLSRGARGGAESTRAGESEHAAQILGATLYHENMEDTRISEGDPTIGIISGLIGQLRPTVIYTHSIHDVHQDHRSTHRAAMVAAREIGRIYCFQSPSATVDFRPGRFVSIDANLETKTMAIDAYRSQMAVRAYLEPDLIEATARYWSRYAEGRYAEAFEVIRDGTTIATSHAAVYPQITRSPPPSASAVPPGPATQAARAGQSVPAVLPAPRGHK